MSYFDNKHMYLALMEAKKAYISGEVPVGCIIVEHNTEQVMASTHNMSEQLQNANAHAEIIAIDIACQKMGSKNLSSCDIYISLEPCTMCASAISNARISRLYYAAEDIKHGAVENGVRFYTTKSCFSRPEIYSGMLSVESSKILLDFFRNLRQNESRFVFSTD